MRRFCSHFVHTFFYCINCSLGTHFFRFYSFLITLNIVLVTSNCIFGRICIYRNILGLTLIEKSFKGMAIFALGKEWVTLMPGVAPCPILGTSNNLTSSMLFWEECEVLGWYQFCLVLLATYQKLWLIECTRMRITTTWAHGMGSAMARIC